MKSLIPKAGLGVSEGGAAPGEGGGGGGGDLVVGRRQVALVPDGSGGKAIRQEFW